MHTCFVSSDVPHHFWFVSDVQITLDRTHEMDQNLWNMSKAAWKENLTGSEGLGSGMDCWPVQVGGARVDDLQGKPPGHLQVERGFLTIVVNMEFTDWFRSQCLSITTRPLSAGHSWTVISIFYLCYKNCTNFEHLPWFYMLKQLQIHVQLKP